MAAAVEAQLRKVEAKLKPYLREGCCSSHWTLVEEKTHLKREHITLGLLSVIALYLAFGWANDFLCNLIGFLYPAYVSILAVESKGTKDDREWLIYWIIYASFGFTEYIGYTFFQTLPLYWLGKCLFLIWLMMPGPKGGSNILYHGFIRPLVHKFHPNIGKSVPTEDDYPTPYRPGGSS